MKTQTGCGSDGRWAWSATHYECRRAIFWALFGISISIRYIIIHFGLRDGLLFGLSWGLCMAIVFKILYMRALSKMKKDKNWVGIKQTRQVSLPIDQKTALGKSIEALSKLKATILSLDENQGEIIAHLGYSRRSFGEMLTLNIKAENPNQTLIAFESKPEFPTVKKDYGKNLENVDRFYRVIDPGSGSDGPENATLHLANDLERKRNMKTPLYLLAIFIVMVAVFISGILLARHTLASHAISRESEAYSMISGELFIESAQIQSIDSLLDEGKIEEAKSHIKLILDGNILHINNILPYLSDRDKMPYQNLFALIARHRQKYPASNENEIEISIQKILDDNLIIVNERGKKKK